MSPLDKGGRIVVKFPNDQRVVYHGGAVTLNGETVEPELIQAGDRVALEGPVPATMTALHAKR